MPGQQLWPQPQTSLFSRASELGQAGEAEVSSGSLGSGGVLGPQDLDPGLSPAPHSWVGAGGRAASCVGTAAYDHVLQRVLGQPAVKEHRDEQVPQRRPEDLRARQVRQASARAGRQAGGSSLTVMMKGSVLIISRTKDTRKICSQMLPWGHRGSEPWGGHGMSGGSGRGLKPGQRALAQAGWVGGTHLVAQVDEQHGLQEADGGHDDLRRRGRLTAVRGPLPGPHEEGRWPHWGQSATAAA